MLKFNENYIDLVEQIENLDWIVYVEKEKVENYNRFILHFSDENYILCTQEKGSIHISYVIEKVGDQKLPSQFIKFLTGEFGGNQEWPVLLFNQMAKIFAKPTHDKIEKLCVREMKYLMFKAAKQEDYLEAAKYRDAIKERSNKS